MAKQKGFVFLEGTLGGLNFYYRNGVPVVRVAGGGFNKKAIKTSPRMVRVRDQNNEFAQCSKINKVFKQSIKLYLVPHKDGSRHSQLMRMFLTIRDLDIVSNRGERKVALGLDTEQGKQLLQDFIFTPKRPKLFNCSYTFNWDSLTFTVSSYSNFASNFAKNSDYLEVNLGVVCFDFNTLTYTDIWATPLVVASDFSGEHFSLGIDTLPGTEGVLYAVVRVTCYQSVNGKPYVLASADSCGLQLFVKGI